MSATNGTVPLIGAKPPLDEMQQNCVDVLSDALEEAMKGRITSLALVVCMNDGIATTMAGTNGLALNLGCDDLKRKIHAAIFEDGNVAPAKKSAIMRAR